MVKNTTKPGSEAKENSKQGLKKEVSQKVEIPKEVSAQEKEDAKKETKPQKVDVIKKIIELHNDGFSTSKIGLILKSEYKIYNVKKYCGKTITQILEENKLVQEIPEDLSNLLKRAVKLIRHMKANKKDMTSKYGYQRTVSKIRRLAKYYKRVGKLPKGWAYSEEQAAILVK